MDLKCPPQCNEKNGALMAVAPCLLPTSSSKGHAMVEIAEGSGNFATVVDLAASSHSSKKSDELRSILSKKQRHVSEIIRSMNARGIGQVILTNVRADAFGKPAASPTGSNSWEWSSGGEMESVGGDRRGDDGDAEIGRCEDAVVGGGGGEGEAGHGADAPAAAAGDSGDGPEKREVPLRRQGWGGSTGDVSAFASPTSVASMENYTVRAFRTARGERGAPTNEGDAGSSSTMPTSADRAADYASVGSRRAMCDKLEEVLFVRAPAGGHAEAEGQRSTRRNVDTEKKMEEEKKAIEDEISTLKAALARLNSLMECKAAGGEAKLAECRSLAEQMEATVAEKKERLDKIKTQNTAKGMTPPTPAVCRRVKMDSKSNSTINATCNSVSIDGKLVNAVSLQENASSNGSNVTFDIEDKRKDMAASASQDPPSVAAAHVRPPWMESTYDEVLHRHEQDDEKEAANHDVKYEGRFEKLTIEIDVVDMDEEWHRSARVASEMEQMPSRGVVNELPPEEETHTNLIKCEAKVRVKKNSRATNASKFDATLQPEASKGCSCACAIM